MILTPLSYYIVVSGVGECVAQALDDNIANGTLGRPGRVVIVPGQEVPWDGCECGQLGFAFQHGPYPTRTFPAESLEDPAVGNCVIGSQAVRVVASLIRCQYQPAMQAGGLPPSETAQNAASRLQQIEQYYMRDAITCCLHAMRRADLIDDIRIGSTDYQVNGNCGEISMIFWLGSF